MLHKNLLFIILLSLNMLSQISNEKALAGEEPKIYQNALLVSIEIEKQVQTSYSGNEFTDTDIKTTTTHGKKKDQSKTDIDTNRFTSLTPSTSIKNIYYFEIKIGDLRYLTTFTPIWGNETDTNWIIGRPIQVRLNDEKNRMYLLRPNGKELKTKVLKIVSI